MTIDDSNPLFQHKCPAKRHQTIVCLSLRPHYALAAACVNLSPFPPSRGMMSVMANGLATREVPDADSSAWVREFGRWMQNEQRRIFLLCLRMLQDQDEADTATQDAFLKAYRAFQKGDGMDLEEPGKWLTRIAVNTCLDRLRSRRWQFWRQRPRQSDEELILAGAAAGSPSAEDQLFARQIETRLAAAMNKLSARQRAVFTLRHYEDHSLEEIGEILRLDTGTVKAHMSRAVAKLRIELRDLYAGRGKRERKGD